MQNQDNVGPAELARALASGCIEPDPLLPTPPPGLKPCVSGGRPGYFINDRCISPCVDASGRDGYYFDGKCIPVDGRPSTPAPANPPNPGPALLPCTTPLGKPGFVQVGGDLDGACIPLASAAGRKMQNSPGKGPRGPRDDL